MSIYRLDDNLVELQKKTGYNIAQENGQRKTGPPPFWTGPPPPKGCEIFIGKLPRNVFEDELFPLFQKAGVIYEFRLMMDFSRSNRGFAFVTYATKEEAKRAIKILNGYEIRPGRRIGVLKSVDNCRLYIGGLPTNKSKEEIYAEITRYTNGVSKVVVHSCPYNQTRNRGFAFVEYESHRAASMARKILIPGNVKLFDCEIVVDWATPNPGVTDEQVKSDLSTSSSYFSNDSSLDLATALYVHRIPAHINEGYLLYLFSFQGCLPIYKIKKLRDFAFVHYFTRRDAEFALSKLNGYNLGGSLIGVTWAKPPNILNLPENRDKFECLIQPRSSKPNSVEYFLNWQYDKNALQNKPAKVLSDICQVNGWGEPIYHVMHTSSSADEVETTFTAKVYIPNLPLPVKSFARPEAFISPKEAKSFVAEYALRAIATFSNDQSHPSPVHSSHKQNSFPIVPDNNVFKGGCANGSNLLNSPEILSYVNNDFLDQDGFLNLLSTAASLASVQLQTKGEPEQIFKMESMN